MRDLGVSSRYAHTDGYTSVCFNTDGSYIITAGTDGELRVWTGINDEDPKTHRISDNVHALCYANNLFIATSDNDVQKRTFPDIEIDATLLRFASAVTCLCATSSGKTIFAGASDFDIKYIDESGDKQGLLSGHVAPVLCVTAHPTKRLLASSSCDGAVKIWDLDSNECIKTLQLLAKSNDFGLSKSFCQMCWTKDGKFLLIPVAQTVQCYSVTDWSKAFTLQNDAVEQNVDIVRFSPCGRYLAMGCRDGAMFVWDYVKRTPIASYDNFRKHGITGLEWNPKNSQEIVITDIQGNIGYFDDVLLGVDTTDIPPPVETVTEVDDVADMGDDLFDGIDDMDDDILATAPDGTESKHGEDDDLDKDVDESERKHTPTVIQAPKVYYQPAFQPSSTPVNLPQRFMLWNSVGIIYQYNTEEESSVDVEFHDTSTHHAVHINNAPGYTMAALSEQIIALAAASDEDVQSVLSCTLLNTNDSGKNWSVSMPAEEDIQCVAVGDGWVAVITSQLYIRVFNQSGTQIYVFSIPGPVVSAAGHGKRLLVTYHAGTGVRDCQCLDAQLFSVGSKLKSLVQGRLPLAPKATLVWLGFTEEGSPATMDSQGRVLMLKRRAGPTWLPISNTRQQVKGKLDNYWILSIHEELQEIRAVLCRGSSYPPTLPKPVLSVLKFELPLCDSSTEKTEFESVYMKSVITQENLVVSPDEEEDKMASLLVAQQEALIKLFALACRSGMEQRAYDVCQLMPTSHTVQLAIKYATRLHQLTLAEKLSKLAHLKAAQEAQVDEELDEWEMPHASDRDRVVYVEPPQQYHDDNNDNGSRATSDVEVDDNEEDCVDQDMQDEDSQPDETPKLIVSSTKEVNFSKITGSQMKKNPFKRSNSQQCSGKGSKVFDAFKPQPKMPKPDPVVKPKKSLVLKKSQPKKSKSIQDKLFTTPSENQKPASEKPVSEKPVENGDSVHQQQKTGFQLWMEENRDRLKEENGGIDDDVELIKAASKAFKQLTSEQRKEWQNKAKSGDAENETNKKRKRSTESTFDTKTHNEDDTKEPEKKKPLSVSNKLSAFAFATKDS